jgi:hypothetical protein
MYVKLKDRITQQLILLVNPIKHDEKIRQTIQSTTR